MFSLFLALFAVQACAFKQAVYWGQSSLDPPLRNMCAPSAGIDIIPLAFITDFGNTPASGAIWLPSGSFGECDLSDPWSPSAGCADLASDIAYCQSQGKQVLVSLGGGLGSYGISSAAEAEAIAAQLFGMFGPPGQGAFPRPFGNVAVDGFDLDIEDGGDVVDYAAMVRRWQILFRQFEPRADGLAPFVVSGAPQCVIPDANLGPAIFNATFDMLFVQFYNTPECSARGQISGYGGPYGGNFTFDAWEAWVTQAGSRSAGAQLFIGLPASTAAANIDDQGRSYWLKPREALKLVKEFRDHPGFAGIMLWDAADENSNIIRGCTYSQQIASILKTGRICRL